MKIVINFLLRSNRESTDNKFPIYVRFTFKNKRVELSTGILIPMNPCFLISRITFLTLC